MAEFFGSDIHQEVLAFWILAVETLNRVLHGRSQFAVGTAELFEKHVTESDVRLVDAHGEHQFFYVVIH
jgi:hypothetical protein